MRTCHTLLGELFPRAFGYRWQHTYSDAALVENYCPRCRQYRHARVDFDRIHGDAYRWRHGRAPNQV